MLKLVFFVLSGAVFGFAVSGVIFHSIRSRVKLYEAYLHERIDSRFEEMLGGARRPELRVQMIGENGRVGYRCSGCGREFSPDAGPVPRQAVARMFTEFKAHVQRDHPAAHPVPPASPAGRNG